MARSDGLILSGVAHLDHREDDGLVLHGSEQQQRCVEAIAPLTDGKTWPSSSRSLGLDDLNRSELLSESGRSTIRKFSEEDRVVVAAMRL